MIKTSTNEYYIVEYGPSGGVLRKINPNISGSSMNEEGHNWTIDSCDKMRSNEYDPERVKKLAKIHLSQDYIEMDKTNFKYLNEK